MVVFLVLAPQPAEDSDGLVDGGSVDPDGLEAAFQGGVLFDVFAVLVHGGGADALKFATGKGGLDDVGGIHCALG